jgi:prepilin-type N-terminal cleavage/methylation domain-containing protein
MKPSSRPASRRQTAGFTLVEVLISMTIVSMVMAMALSTFLFGLRMMYKDTQRLATNATLRYFMAQTSKATLDASEFYIYPNYESINSATNSLADLTTATSDYYDIDLYHGDCLVLVTRTSLENNSNIRQICIYYRSTTDPNKEASIRYYEGKDYGTAGTTDTLDTLLRAVNLKADPNRSGSIQIAARVIGRPITGDTHNPQWRYPIFSSKAPTITTENESVAINAEVINGTTINNMLSSSSFNYTISPRR